MKVLFIHIYYTNAITSGASAIVFSLWNFLKNNGHEPYIFATDEKPYIDDNYPYTKYFPKGISNLDKNTISGYFKRLFIKVYNKEAKKNIEKMLDEIKPDIVHIHSVWELSYSIIKPITERNIPIIYTAHDVSYCCPAISFIGKKRCNKCKGHNTLPCLFNKCIKNNFIFSLYFAFKSFVDRILFPINIAKCITVPSQATKDVLVKFNIPEEKIIVVENCINSKEYENEMNLTNKGYFLYAGGIMQPKGIFTLLEAIKDLPRDIEFHILGHAGSDALKEKFTNYCNEHNLYNVKYLGAVDKKTLREEYKNCISVIMPSESFETFGMITIEAATFGKPSIGANIGGIPYVIDENKTGLLFESGNSEALKNCILKYWEDADLVKLHGENAYKKANEKYSEEIFYNKMIKIYEKVCSDSVKS